MGFFGTSKKLSNFDNFEKENIESFIHKASLSINSKKNITFQYDLNSKNIMLKPLELKLVDLYNTDLISYNILKNKKKIKKINFAKFSSAKFLYGDFATFYISLNELAYNISIKNTSMACYWIEWILEFEALSKKKKNIVFRSIRRDFIPVDNKYQMDIIWIVWELFIHHSLKFNYLKDTIKSLLNIFCIRYKSGVKKKKKICFILRYIFANRNL